MNKDKIITELYLSKDISDFIKKFKPEHLQGDLLNESVIKIIELHENKILDLQSELINLHQ